MLRLILFLFPRGPQHVRFALSKKVRGDHSRYSSSVTSFLLYLASLSVLINLTPNPSKPQQSQNRNMNVWNPPRKSLPIAFLLDNRITINIE